MCLTIHIPEDEGAQLKAAFGADLDRAALEALVVEGYRTRRFGIGQVRRLLGLPDRWEAERWLGSRGVTWNYDASDLEADRQTLDELFGRSELC